MSATEWNARPDSGMDSLQDACSKDSSSCVLLDILAETGFSLCSFDFRSGPEHPPAWSCKGAVGQLQAAARVTSIIGYSSQNSDCGSIPRAAWY
jgi:hypothetical protein